MADAAELLKLAETDVGKEITMDQFGPIIMKPPFIFVDGTFNTRDLGLIPGSPILPGLVYRSGGISRITDNGKAAVAAKMGVKRVFDVRSSEERSKDPDPELADIENTWLDSLEPDSQVDLNLFVSGLGEQGYAAMYLRELDVYQPTWRAVLDHVRDRPREPVLIHCTAGRDRTGIISGLLLTLAGASPDVVTLDYMLSRIGTEPVRQILIAFAMAGTGAKTQQDAGFYNLISLRKESWKAFVEAVQKRHGGFEQFVEDKLGFSKDDVAKIKANLTASA